MNKIYVTGANGYIGKALVKAGAFPLISDVTNFDAVEAEIFKTKPNIILHLASKSDVDFCQDKKNQEVVIKTNLRGTHNVMYAADSFRVPVVLFSSDQIWDGSILQKGVYKENARPTPAVNFYGMSKVAAEHVAATFGQNVIRTSYVFDKERLDKRYAEGGVFDEPTFIRRSFIYLNDFVELIEEYCKHFYTMPRILHLAGSETVSWYEFSKRLPYNTKPRRFEKRGFAPRPKHAGLSTSLAQKLGFKIPSYKDGIERMLNES